MLDKPGLCVLLSALLTLCPGPGRSHELPQDNTAAQASPSVVELEVPDLELIDQDSAKRRFLSDCIGDRLAVVSFVYTNCATICPVLDSIFLKLQAKLAGDLGNSTVLITVSIDPVNDIPARLKAHAAKLGARAGWSFLTGDKQTVTRLLQGFEVFTTDILNHPSTVYVADGRHGAWTRLNGFPPPAKIIEVLDGYRAARVVHLQE